VEWGSCCKGKNGPEPAAGHYVFRGMWCNFANQASAMKTCNPPVRRTIIAFLITFCFSLTLPAQTGWQEIKSDVVNAYTNATVIEALGKNQAGTIIYAGIEKNVLAWSGTGWTKLGTAANTFNGNVITVTTDVTGNVYAAGNFTNAGGKYYVAKWNGSTWSEVGALNANGPIGVVMTDGAGNIYAAGSFSNTLDKRYVAKWNGSAWSELGGAGALGANNFINTLAIDGTGNIYAAGNFSNASAKRYVAKFNGSTWSELGGTNALNASQWINSIAVDAAGNVYAAGAFTNAASHAYVAKFNGSTWSELGGINALNTFGQIETLAIDATGNVYAGGDFSLLASSIRFVAKFNGSTWSEVGAGAGALNANDAISKIVIAGNGDLFATGEFSNSINFRYVAWWKSSTNAWTEAGLGGVGTLSATGTFHSLIALSPNEVYATGNVQLGNGHRSVLKWNGLVWRDLGLNAPFEINVIKRDNLGNLYAAGDFANGGNPFGGKRYVAKWDGNSWTELGGFNSLNANGAIYDMVIDAQNNVYVAGDFTNANGKYYVAKFNGSTWSEVGSGANALNANGRILTMDIDAAGNIYAGGYFSNDFSVFTCNVLKWNGTTWSEVGPHNAVGADFIKDILVVGSNLYVVGNGISINGVPAIIKWNGSTWTKFTEPTGIFSSGDGSPGVLEADAAGNIYVSGSFLINGYRGIMKFDGTNWGQVGVGPAALNTIGIPHDIAIDNTNTIYTAGSFVNSNNSIYVARFDLNAIPLADIVNVSDKCRSAATAKGKLRNPPAGATVTVTIDGNAAAYSAADSSFTYFVSNTTAAGNHTVRVVYTVGAGSSQRDVNFIVTQDVLPTITISGNSVVVTGQSTSITGVITNGGSSAQYQWQDSINATGWRNITGGIDPFINYVPAATGHRLRCRLTSNATCAAPTVVYSNVIIFTVNFPTAVNPVPAGRFQIRLYPNPTPDILWIDSLKLQDLWQTLEIRSTDGAHMPRMVSIVNKTVVQVPVSDLTRGVYVAILRRKNGETAYIKFVKL
jgi:hypothetical protein